MVATAKLTGVQDVFRGLERWKQDAHRSMVRAAETAVTTFHGKVTRENLGSKGVNSAPLRRALKSEVRAGQGIVGRVWFRRGHWERIARVHEFGTKGKGGTMPDIVAKRVKHLAIPSDYVKKRFGKAHGRGTKRPKHVVPKFKKTFVFPTKRHTGKKARRYRAKGRKYWLAQVGAETELLFTLIKRPKGVALKPRLGFYASWAKFEPRAYRMLDRAKAASVRRAGF